MMATVIGLFLGALTMQTLDGLDIVMTNYDERRGTVLVFLSSRCEATEKAIEEINRTHERHRQSGVLFVGLFANDDESAEEIRTFCQNRGVIFPVYRDPGAAIAERLGASVSPEAFVLDKSGTVVYQGSFIQEDAIQHIGEAIRSLVRGKTIEEPLFDIPGGTPIGEKGTPREIEDPYGYVSFSSELIFDKIPGAPAHHCSTIAEMPGGGLVCVWYGGSYESADDQVLFISRFGGCTKEATSHVAAGERSWSAPEVLLDGDHLHPPGNAVVFRLNDSRLGLIWGRMDATRPIRRGGGWGQCQLIYRFSDDDGHTWSDDTELEGEYGGLPRNVPIILDDGTFAVPLSGHVNGTRGSFLLTTCDSGQTWTPGGVASGGSQPTVIQRNDGTLLAFMRTQPFIAQSTSSDLGKTWSKTSKTELRCPSAGIAMCRLANGHLLLVHNNSSVARTPLSIVRSTDEGITWEKSVNLECNPGEYSYPCIIQTSDGKIHVTYTFRRYAIKHVEINEEWLTNFDRPN